MTSTLNSATRSTTTITCARPQSASRHPQLTSHSHYAYWIHAAALIAHMDPSWLTPLNKAYINTLVKDACNPISSDPSFPFSRAFDWYHGHSWAHGLTEVADGKDQESTSEDAHFAYAIKMWGHVIGDKSMEARGNLMLAILARSVQNYFLMESGNVNQPARFIANKVTGIVSLPNFHSISPNLAHSLSIH